MAARRIARDALVRFEDDDPDRARIAACLGPLGDENRQLVHELTFGAVRRLRTIDRVLLTYLKDGLPAHAPTRAALRLGVLQLAWMRTAPHAAVHTSVSLVQSGSRAGLVNAVLRRVSEALRPADAPIAANERAIRLPSDRVLVMPVADDLPAADSAGWAAFEQGLPGWLVEGWERTYGATAARGAARASSEPPSVFLRTRRGTAVEVRNELTSVGCHTVPIPEHPDVLKIVGGSGQAWLQTVAYAEGRLLAQDPTAVRAVDAVGAQEGERLLDLCAAPGTKTTRLANQVGESGRVVAVDPNQGRAELIEDNVRRLRFDNVEVVRVRAQDLGETEPFDAVLADVPCSNTGVLARRPEVRLRITPSDLRSLARLQFELLGEAARRARPGGRIVYSTCSLESCENLDIVRRGLASLPLRLEVAHTTLPLAGRHDGGFYARLVRT